MTAYGQQVQTLRGPGPIHPTDPSQANEADADEDTNEDDSDDEGSIDKWSTKDLEYKSIDGGEHPRMGWVINDPLSVDYYEIIIPNPTYITHRLIIAPFISYSIQPFKAEVSATYGKGYHVVTRALTPTCVSYHCVPAMPAHIALLNTTPISDAIQSVVSTHFPMHLNAAFKCYCHFQEQKYATQGRIQCLKDRITGFQELESKMIEKATCVLSEMEDANFWGRLYTVLVTIKFSTNSSPSLLLLTPSSIPLSLSKAPTPNQHSTPSLTLGAMPQASAISMMVHVTVPTRTTTDIAPTHLPTSNGTTFEVAQKPFAKPPRTFTPALTSTPPHTAAPKSSPMSTESARPTPMPPSLPPSPSPSASYASDATSMATSRSTAPTRRPDSDRD
jgi:hypothetical protein